MYTKCSYDRTWGVDLTDDENVVSRPPVLLPLNLYLIRFLPILRPNGNAAYQHVNGCRALVHLPLEIGLPAKPAWATVEVEKDSQHLLVVVSTMSQPRRGVCERQRKRSSPDWSDSSVHDGLR